jgi:hypothetical protein
VFVDGVGIGPSDDALNPFLAAALPTLRSLLGGDVPTLERPSVTGARATAFPLDALLGVEGIPQSGTGQTALLTGLNAPQRFGRHFGPWVPVSLRPALSEENILVRAVRGGRRVAFANAYPADYLALRPRRVAAPPLAADSAGLLVRHSEALGRGEAVSSEIVNDGWRKHLGHTELPVVSPDEAGRNLARIAAAHELTFFAHYATDHVGHRGGRPEAIRALERLDAFIGGLLDEVPENTSVVVASDHGNIEDVTKGHTLNPALGLVIDADHERWSGVTALTDVAPQICRSLGLEAEKA